MRVSTCVRSSQPYQPLNMNECNSERQSLRRWAVQNGVFREAAGISAEDNVLAKDEKVHRVLLPTVGGQGQSGAGGGVSVTATLGAALAVNLTGAVGNKCRQGGGLVRRAERVGAASDVVLLNLEVDCSRQQQQQ
jgi:hypothetical protein